jgi:hypothetical protein
MSSGSDKNWGSGGNRVFGRCVPLLKGQHPDAADVSVT